MGDYVRCAYYKRSITHGYSSGYEHQIIDFFDPREASKHHCYVGKKFIEMHQSVAEFHQFLSPLRMLRWDLFIQFIINFNF